MTERFTTGNSNDWANASLTPDEKAQIEESQRDLERGEYLTLKELIEGL